MSCKIGCCKKFSLVLALLAMVAALGAPHVVIAQTNIDDPNGPFQTDGNAIKDPGNQTNGQPPLLCCGTDTAGAPAEAYAPCPTVSGSSFNTVQFGTNTDDWSVIYDDITNGHHNGHYVAATFAGDAAGGNSDPTTFLGTSSKDTDPISTWTWQAHSVQSKADIEHAYAAAYAVNGQTWLYLGMDRLDGSGTTTAGFWLVQDANFDMCTGLHQGSRGPNNNCTTSGTFTGQHTDGDLLVVSDFSNGGAVATINIFKWSGGANGTLPSNPDVSLSTGASCNPVNPTHTVVCGLVSNAYTQGTVHGKAALIPALISTGGWGYFDLAKPPHSTIPTGGFLELAVNLDAPGLFASNAPCFSTFFAETRSSTSVGSSLSDLAPPQSFKLCTVAATKKCGGVSGKGNSQILTLSGGNCVGTEACTGADVVRYYFSGTIDAGGKTLYHANLTDTPPAASYVSGSLLINGTAASPGTAFDIASTDGGFTGSVSYTGQFDSSAILGANDRNSVTASASSSTSGTPQDVTTDSAVNWGDTTSCNPTPSPGLGVAKLCNSCLTGTTTLTVSVNEGVKVCNTGDVPLTGVGVKDCEGAAWANGSCPSPGVEHDFATVNLAQTGVSDGSDCHVFNYTYNPTSSNFSSTCSVNGTSGCSTDFVIASGTIGSNFCTPTQQDDCTRSNSAAVEATCPLCPVGAVGSCTTYNTSSTWPTLQ